MTDKTDPSQIMQIGMGFFASKTLLSAVEMGLFTKLAEQPLTRAEIEIKLGLHQRSSADFLDVLVSLGMLSREGNGDQAIYSNTPQTNVFLDQKSPDYIGGIFEMASVRLYKYWADLTEALKTGKPQNEIKTDKNSEHIFDAIHPDPANLEAFLSSMAGLQKGNFMTLAEKFDFTKHGTVCDLGGASGAFSVAVAKRHPNVQCISFDLAQVLPIAQRTIDHAGVAAQVKAQAGDFFKDPLPKANVMTMGSILHDWSTEHKKMLIKKVYDALPAGGCFIAIENIIDDERRKNTFGLLMSLNMLIETGEGADYTGAQFKSWCSEAGFRSVEIMPLTGSSSAAIAYK
jgi:hypothetical protein